MNYLFLALFLPLLALGDTISQWKFKAPEWEAPLTLSQSFDNQSYWIISGNFLSGSTSDLVSGSLNGEIKLHSTPNGRDWKTQTIAYAKGSIHAVLFDMNNDGNPDLIVAYRFGSGCPNNCQKGDGAFMWLENPGYDGLGTWKSHFLANSTYPPHRIAVLGASSPSPFLQVTPIAGFNNLHAPFDISVFSLPTLSNSIDSTWTWNEIVVANDLTICHDGKSVECGSSICFAVACAEGLFQFSIDTETSPYDSKSIARSKDWKRTMLVPALTYPHADAEKPLTGTSSFAFLPGNTSEIAFMGPLHGSHIGISRNLSTGRRSLIIDQISTVYSGSGHDIQPLPDISPDTSSTFLAAFRLNQTRGIYAYTKTGSSWQKVKLLNSSVSMMTIADFNNDGLWDVASINWGSQNNSDITIIYQKPTRNA